MEQFMSRRTKAQVFSTDFVVSAAVFSLMVSIFIFSWNTMVDQQLNNINEKDRHETGLKTTNTLITRQTNDWEQQTYAGLASKPYVLNYSKIQEFKKLNNSKQASLLDASNFSLQIDAETQKIETGYKPNGTYALPFRRNITLQKNNTLQDAEMELIIWG